MGEVLVDAGHSELDLVTHTLLWTFGCVSCRDAEEQQAEQGEPQGARTEVEVEVHLRGKITAALTSFRLLCEVVIHSLAPLGR